jgi:hypothetical protein
LADKSAPRGWGLGEWASIATILGLGVAVLSLIISRSSGSVPGQIRTNEPAPSATSSIGAPANSASPTISSDATTRFLTAQSSSTDPQQISPFRGYAESLDPQEVNGKQYFHQVAFELACDDTSDKYVDYNLGHHYTNFSTTIGLSDISISSGYHFEVLADGRQVFSQTLRRGTAKRLSIDVKGVLTLRLSACSLKESEINATSGGALFSDPEVIGHG